ncbi:hypothetical protein FIBSPDRAFT_864456, partial [Athelia psychrophila]
MKSSVRLAKTGGPRPRAHKEAAMNRLAADMDGHQLHRYREGRAWGYTQDDLDVQ